MHTVLCYTQQETCTTTYSIPFTTSKEFKNKQVTFSVCSYGFCTLNKFISILENVIITYLASKQPYKLHAAEVKQIVLLSNHNCVLSTILLEGVVSQVFRKLINKCELYSVQKNISLKVISAVSLVCSVTNEDSVSRGSRRSMTKQIYKLTILCLAYGEITVRNHGSRKEQWHIQSLKALPCPNYCVTFQLTLLELDLQHILPTDSQFHY